MNSRILSLTAVLGSLCLLSSLRAKEPGGSAPPSEKADGAESVKPELPDYIRFADDAKSARLEIAVKSFKLPSGTVIDLIGVVHIADAAYYADLNKRFDGYDAVLFELVGDPAALTKKQEAARPLETKESGKETKEDSSPGSGGVRFIQNTAGRLLKLSFQLDQIDYTKPNMVHADASWEEFARMQKERGESMMGLFMRAMKAQMSGELDNLPVKELDTFGLLRILMSRDSAAEFKIVLGKMFDQAESMTAIMEGEEGSAILSDRNAVVLRKIREVIADPAKKRIGVFYGAAHMPGIEGMLINDLKAQPAGEEWLPGWTMPHEPVEAEKPAEKP